VKEFRFLVFLIVVLQVSLFVCGLNVVANRHEARELFIQLEREQQTQHMLTDERSQLKLEVANLEQTAKIGEKAAEAGLIQADPSNMIILPRTGADPKPAGADSPTQGAAR
jgi:cell division protein FtsL